MTEMKGDPGPAAAEDKATTATTVAVVDTAVADGGGSSSDGEFTVIETIESGASEGESEEGGDLWRPSGISFDPDEKERGSQPRRTPRTSDAGWRPSGVRCSPVPISRRPACIPPSGPSWDDKEISDLREIKAKLLAGSGTALAGVLTASVLAWANFWKAELQKQRAGLEKRPGPTRQAGQRQGSRERPGRRLARADAECGRTPAAPGKPRCDVARSRR